MVRRDPAITHVRRAEGYYLLYNADGETKGVITPAGRLVSGASWAGGIDSAAVVNGRLWMYGDQDGLRNIVDPEGRELLTDRQRYAFHNYQVRSLGDWKKAVNPGLPLALLTQEGCQCGPGGSEVHGSGVLRADGSVLVSSNWDEIDLADDETDLDALRICRDTGIRHCHTL